MIKIIFFGRRHGIISEISSGQNKLLLWQLGKNCELWNHFVEIKRTAIRTLKRVTSNPLHAIILCGVPNSCLHVQTS